MDPNNCPKENCGRPASTSRTRAGKKLLICGNSHEWDPEEVAAQRAKAKEAEDQEGSFKYNYPVTYPAARRRIVLD